MSVKVPENRKITREGGNSKAFFEWHDCVCVEIPQQDDIGKDAYIDIGKSSKLTPLCAALQIRSGESGILALLLNVIRGSAGLV